MLLSNTGLKGTTEADWSPDGELMVFTAGPEDPSATSAIYVSEPDGDHLIQLSTPSWIVHAATFSAEGNRIAFVSAMPGADGFFTDSDPRLFLASLGFNQVEEVELGIRGTVADPQWSPVGDWISFNFVTLDGESDIYIVRPDGSQLTRLTLTPDIWEGATAWRYYVP